MSLDKKHALYGVELGAASPVVLGGVQSVNVRTDTEHRAEATSGDAYPRHIAIVGQKPYADFESVCVARCLAQISMAGLSIATLTNGLSLYAYKHADGGARASGASHRKYNFKKGLIVPQRITCEHKGDAVISYAVHPTWDGTNDPVVITDSSAVPTAPADDERFTLGPTTIGSVSITGVKSWELDFGINAVPDGADSDIWNTFVSIEDVIGVLTLKGVNVEWLKSTNIPLTGKAATHANTSTYLRKRLQTSAGYVANGTAEHIKVTGAGLCWVEDIMAGRKGGAECSLKMAVVYDGTNLPFVVNSAAAIT